MHLKYLYVVGNTMDLFRWGLEPEVVRLDWAGSRTALELRSDDCTSRRFLWTTHTDCVAEGQT